MTSGLGVYGTNYTKRAVVAAFECWPANLEKDAIYPYTDVDSKGAALSGANKYTVTYSKGETPPVNRLLVGYNVQDRQGLIVSPK